MARLKKHAQAAKLPFPIIHDQMGKICHEYGVKAFPTAYLIGPDGKVIWNGHPSPGLVPMFESKINAAIKEAKELKAEKEGDPPPTTQPAESDDKDN